MRRRAPAGVYSSRGNTGRATELFYRVAPNFSMCSGHSSTGLDRMHGCDTWTPFHPMKRSLLEKAKLASEFPRGPTDPPWEPFRRDWTAFNAICTGTKRSGDSEDGW